MAPSLARNLEDDESITKRKKAEEYGGRGDAMDLDDDSDDEQSVPHSSPDSSFEVITVVTSKTAVPVEYDEATKVQRVVDTLSSYDDLKFLIGELRKANRRHCSVVFGAGDIWKVAPPVTQWTSQRRATFTGWAKAHLGFTVRSAGMGITYVQISKLRGTQVLETLEAALIEYTKTAQGNQQVVEVPPQTLFTTFSASTTSLGAATGSFGSVSSCTEPPVSILYVRYVRNASRVREQLLLTPFYSLVPAAANHLREMRSWTMTRKTWPTRFHRSL